MQHSCAFLYSVELIWNQGFAIKWKDPGDWVASSLLQPALNTLLGCLKHLLVISVQYKGCVCVCKSYVFLSLSKHLKTKSYHLAFSALVPTYPWLPKFYLHAFGPIIHKLQWYKYRIWVRNAVCIFKAVCPVLASFLNINYGKDFHS